MANKISIAITVATLLIVVAVGGIVIQTVDSDVLAYTEQAGEWCQERNGTLHNAQVLGPHGGLHCELPNGTSVHMSEVISANTTDA